MRLYIYLRVCIYVNVCACTTLWGQPSKYTPTLLVHFELWGFRLGPQN